MKVIFTPYAHALLREYVEQCQYEISGAGKVIRDEENNFVITDLAVLPQQVTGATTDITSAEMAKFQVELIRKGENVGEWYLWWHSHVNMEVFWSERDKDTMDDSTDYKRLLSVVTNKRDEYRARLDVYEPERMYMDNLDVEIQLPERDAAMVERVKKDIADHVTHKTYTPIQNTYAYNSRQPQLGVPSYQQVGFGSYHDDEEEGLDVTTVPTTIESPGEYEQFHAYLTEKNELEQELADAVAADDAQEVEALQQALYEHVEWGINLGFEDNHDDTQYQRGYSPNKKWTW